MTSNTSTAMPNINGTTAMRQIRDQLVMDLKTRKPTTALLQNLPVHFLDGEPEDDKVRLLWGKFVTTAIDLCKARNALFPNKRYRKMVFDAAMDNHCKEFSRRTETLKLQFQISRTTKTTRLGKKKTQTRYQLTLLKLSPIPEACRNIQFCTAEIPPTEQQAYAEFVTMTEIRTRSGRYATVIQVEEEDNEDNEEDDMEEDGTDSERSASTCCTTATNSSTATEVEESHGGVLVITTNAANDGNEDSDDNTTTAANELLVFHYHNPPVALAVPEETEEEMTITMATAEIMPKYSYPSPKIRQHHLDPVQVFVA